MISLSNYEKILSEAKKMSLLSEAKKMSLMSTVLNFDCHHYFVYL
jgi:hypothetical protein